jgi:uncharacterized protein with PQ loop repeat
MKKIVLYLKENKLGGVTILFSLSYMFLGLPLQIWRIWETHSVKEISLPMFGLLCLQSIFWVLYGIQQKDWFVVTANAFCSFFAFIIVLLYFAFV